MNLFPIVLKIITAMNLTCNIRINIYVTVGIYIFCISPRIISTVKSIIDRFKEKNKKNSKKLIMYPQLDVQLI